MARIKKRRTHLGSNSNLRSFIVTDTTRDKTSKAGVKAYTSKVLSYNTRTNAGRRGLFNILWMGWNVEAFSRYCSLESSVMRLTPTESDKFGCCSLD